MRMLRILGALLAALTIYLLAWPVPIEPVAWEAPENAGLVGRFSANDLLAPARRISLGEYEGPEDIAAGPDGLLYSGTRDGVIVRFDRAGARVEEFADAGGRPLGLEFDADGNLLVANAHLGLQRIGPGGAVEVLADEFGGEPIRYADDVAVAADGMIYFSDASSRFGARDFGGSYEASLLDILEHGGHGRVFRHDVARGETTIVLDGLNFANGVAISADQQFLLVNETGSYRVLRHWLAGPLAGRTDVLIDNLPGFPDNVNNGMQERFWIGLVAPRSDLLDGLSGSPFLRKLVQRLPAALRPQAVPSAHVIAIDAAGDVVMNLQDTAAAIPALTGVLETPEALWLSSLFGAHVGRLDKRDLASR